LDFNALEIFAVTLVALTSILLFLLEDWRVSIILLAIQYIGVFILVNVQWPISMAVVKLVAGWMCGAILGIAISGLPTPEDKTNPEEQTNGIQEVVFKEQTYLGRTRPKIGRTFYLLTTLLMGLVVISQAQRALSFFPEIRIEQIWGVLILIGMGLLKVGFTQQPMPVTIGLLTALSGFEILYASIDITPLVAGIFAGINLGLALAGAYLLTAPHLEESL
jgi:hypothetical protein